VSDIDTAVVDSLKVLDPKRPIREADMIKLAARSTVRAAISPAFTISASGISLHRSFYFHGPTGRVAANRTAGAASDAST